MGEKGNLPIDDGATRGLPKVGHPAATKDPAAGMAAKDPAAGMAAKEIGPVGAPPAPPAPPASGPPPTLPGMGGFVAGREARRDDDPPATGA